MKTRYHKVASRTLCVTGLWLLAADFVIVIWWAS